MLPLLTVDCGIFRREEILQTELSVKSSVTVSEQPILSQTFVRVVRGIMCLEMSALETVQNV